MAWEFGVRRKLLNSEWISSEVLLYSTGNSIQSLGLEHDGGDQKTVFVFVCERERLGHFAVQKLAQHCKSTVL